jgi:phosphopentomutase
MRRAAVIVLDGVGIGPAPDTAAYGDIGSDTFGNVARAAGGLALPNLQRLGLGNIADLPGVPPAASPAAAWGAARPAAAGKDSITGHWELCGQVITEAFPTFPDGFPTDLLDAFAERTGRGVLCNRAASGTAVLDEFGAVHLATGQWIV